MNIRIVGASLLVFVCSCAVPDQKPFDYPPKEARSCLAKSLTTMKEDPKNALTIFDVPSLSAKIRKYSQNEDITDEQVAIELVAMVSKYQNDLPRLLPPGLIHVSMYTSMSDNTYTMQANVPVHTANKKQFLVTLVPTNNSCRLKEMTINGFSFSALIAGVLAPADDYENFYHD